MKKWIKAAGIRALKTFVQTAVAMVTVGSAISDINWINVLSISTVAALCSLLTSVAGVYTRTGQYFKKSAEINQRKYTCPI